MFPKNEVGFVKNVKGCETYSSTASESRVDWESAPEVDIPELTAD